MEIKKTLKNLADKVSEALTDDTPAKKPTKKKRTPKKKVEYSISEANRAVLSNYLNKMPRYISQSLQVSLLACIEEDRNFQYEPTDCGKCWFNKIHPILEEIAAKNGIKHG